MTFPCYPKYKASGFIWLGDVPESWALKRLGHYFDERRERASDTEFEPLSVTKNGIVPRLESAAKTQDGDNRKKVLAGDFVINSRSDRKGSSGLSPLDGSVSLICTVLTPSGLHGPFIHHLFRSELFQEEYYRWGKGIVADLWSTNFSDMKNIVLGVPSEAEQTQIARFLDHETARIDALIEEQQCLIELLKEKRQAVISHAVTKGLDPKVPMKDSRVEWLGEVPVHWDVVCVKHIKSWRPNAFVDGPFGSNLKSEHFVDDGGVYVIESNFATTGELSFSDLKQITPNHFETIRRSEVCAGDIVIAKIGARYGMCSILPWLDKPAVVSGNSLKLTVNEEVCDSRFAVFVLKHLKERGAIEDIVNMTAQPALSLGEMNNLPFPLPPLCDQLSIVSDLEIRLGEFEALTSECRQVMSLAIERRSALISAAVTGKIDVRGWQLPASAPTPELAQEAV